MNHLLFLGNLGAGEILLIALIVLLLLTFAAIMVACRITPMMLIDMFRPPEYEYEDEEERAR